MYKFYIDIWVECLPFLFKWIEWHLTGRMFIQKSPSTKSRPCFSLWGSKDLDWQHHCITLNNKGEEWRGDLKWWHSNIFFTLYCNFSGTYTGQHKFNSNSNIHNLPSQHLYKVSPSCSLSSHPTPPGVPNLTSPNSIVIQLQLLDSGHFVDTIFSNWAEISEKAVWVWKILKILCFISCTSGSINIYISKTNIMCTVLFWNPLAYVECAVRIMELVLDYGGWCLRHHIGGTFIASPWPCSFRKYILK